MVSTIPIIQVWSRSSTRKKNVGPDHLSRTDTSEEPTGIEDNLPDAHLFRIKAVYFDLAEIA